MRFCEYRLIVVTTLLGTGNGLVTHHPFWNRKSSVSKVNSFSHSCSSDNLYNKRNKSGLLKRRRNQRNGGIRSLCMYFDDCERQEGIPGGRDDQSPVSSSSHTPWIISYSDEKKLAMEKLLGFNPISASKLSVDRIEDETLQWAIDTQVLWAGMDDEGNDDDDAEVEDDGESYYDAINKNHCMYQSISDLVVEDKCTNVSQCLASMWGTLSRRLFLQAQQREQRQQADSDSTSETDFEAGDVFLLVFPNCPELWNYHAMAEMLQSIQICKQQFPQITTSPRSTAGTTSSPSSWYGSDDEDEEGDYLVADASTTKLELKMDLFHPHYKNSPRMWSPKLHSPFPTVGIRLVAAESSPRTTTSSSPPSKPSSLESTLDRFLGDQTLDDGQTLDLTRSKLQKLFDSVDAVPDYSNIQQQQQQQTGLGIIDPDQAVEMCQDWFLEQTSTILKTVDTELVDWMVEEGEEPHQLYSLLWESISQLTEAVTTATTTASSTTSDNNGRNNENNIKSSIMIVAPKFDSHTTFRVAVTVNTALNRMKLPVRISHVFHPNNNINTKGSTTATHHHPSPFAMIHLQQL